VKRAATLGMALERFDQLSLRERAIVSIAILAVLFVLWDSLLMAPLKSKQSTLSQDLTQVEGVIKANADVISTGAGSDSDREARARLQQLQTQLSVAGDELASIGAGLIPPERMVHVIRDMLSRRQSLRLVSLRSEPVRSLVPPAPPDGVESPPYVHPVELVIEGTYADVLAYVQALESLPWSFYWKTLELTTLEYPDNRVRIELMTLSMEKAWLGV